MSSQLPSKSAVPQVEPDTRLKYWEQQLVGRSIQLPADRSRAAAGYVKREAAFALPPALVKSIMAWRKSTDKPQSELLLAAFLTLIYRYTHQSHFIVGSLLSDRDGDLVLLPVRLSPEMTPDDLLAGLQQTQQTAVAHHIPWPQLQTQLNIPSPAILFAYNQTAVLPEAELAFSISDHEDEIVVTIAYDGNLFAPETITRLWGHYRMLVKAMVQDLGLAIGELPLLTAAERQQMLVTWNETAVTHPNSSHLPDRFAAQAAQTPDKVALVMAHDDQQQLTYRQLDARANQLARHLQALGVKNGQVAAVLMTRSLEMVVALLGVLKAGGTYLPIDPTYPQERIHFMLDDAQPLVVLTQQTIDDSQWMHNGLKPVRLDTDWDVIAKQPEVTFSVPILDDSLAYIIYTSGSSGHPKGVQITHGALTNFLAAMQHKPGLTAEDILLALTTISFDIAILELFLPLIAGGKVVLADQDLAGDAARLTQTLAESGATVMQATPVTWHLLVDAGWQGDGRLTMLCGGEKLSRHLAAQLLARGRRLWNMYGPTETTVWSAVYEVQSVDQPIPIGPPIANTQFFVLDERGQPVPIGVPGELHIGGSGLARGYMNRPGLTAEKFPPFFSPPLGGIKGGRLYKTGDLVRYRADGTLEFLGRIDRQVKHHGFRIELGEIEAVLQSHKAVAGNVVIAHGESPDRKQLVAYVVPRSGYNPAQESAVTNQVVTQWQLLYDQIYSQQLPDTTPLFNTVGWNSSYTHQPIPQPEMQEWIDHTLNQILPYQPKRVIEIGCGSGLLLFPLAPHCEHYWGVDFSQTALDLIAAQLNEQGLSGKVTLLRQTAVEFAGFEAETADAVVLNSVVQYFPGVDYLLAVLAKAIAVTKAGGFVFVGDVRNLWLLETFHTSVQLQHATPDQRRDELRQLVQQQIEREHELLLSPDFFPALKQHFPRISHVRMQLKRGNYHNELTRFRYDVILYIEHEAVPVAEPTWQAWMPENFTVADIRSHLAEMLPESWGIRQVPNARLSTAARTAAWLNNTGGGDRVDDCLATLPAVPTGIDPEQLYRLAATFPYDVEIRWSDSGGDGRFDVIFNHRHPGKPQPPTSFPDSGRPVLPWTHYANNPIKSRTTSQIASELRQHLQAKLPAYMVPSAFILLDKMPLTPNGKIDRQALPVPDSERPRLKTTFVPPQSKLEQLLAEMWQESLGIDEIGIHDNFFELGGDSIKGALFINKLQEKLNAYLYIVALFEAPTIALLAAYLHTHYADALPAVLGTGRAFAGGEDDSLARVEASHLAQMRQLIRPLPDASPLVQKNPPAIFILSPPRSGSTLLRVMMAGHPALFVPPELDLLSYENLGQRHEQLSAADNFRLEGSLRALMEIKQIDAAAAQRLMAEYEAEAMATPTFYGLLQQWIHPQTLVDKSTFYALNKTVLQRAETFFEKAVYIHLTRHPYGMIYSFQDVRLDRIYFNRSHPFTARQLGELIWIVCHQNIIGFLRQVPPARQIRVRYEDLVRQPEPEMTRLSQFLGLTPHPAMWHPYEDQSSRMTDGIYDLAQSRMVGDVKFHEHAGIDPKTADRWREQHAHPFLGDIAAVLARSFGYKPEPATIHEEISPARAAELLANLDSLSDEEINALLEALDQ